MITPDYDYRVETSYTLHLFTICLLLCSYHSINIIKKLALRLLVFLI